jgi:4-hydroxy-3-polyprenylbenzoate decarboxylase
LPRAKPLPLIVAITGATGSIFGIRLLERLRELDVETHLIVSGWGRVNIERETSYTLGAVRELAHVVYADGDQGAAVSSGSFRVAGMVIAPCSMRTLAGIATGAGHNLVCRAADVALKERRRLVAVVRETPLNAIHLRNMLTLAEAGATIFPLSPAFYNRPQTIDDLVDHLVVRVLDQLDLDVDYEHRWAGLEPPAE